MGEPPTGLAEALRDRYVLERELGRGGMATVWLARDLRHEREVALKVLHPELATSLGPERFLREIRIAAGLTHPRILAVFDSGAADGFLYYVMPYVKGESLRARLRREVQLPLEPALRMVSQVADALEYAHERGIIHRDIKPENILLMENGEPMVADFGLALALSAAGGERLTETGLALGTPAYMSPEQAAGEHQFDGRTDIYSLGCVLYELLAGEPPFTGPTAQAIIAKRFGAAPPSIRIVREGVPPAVEHAIERALAKAPADRFTTADQFARALHESPAAPRRRSLVEVAPWALVIGLALAAGGFLRWRTGTAPPTDPNLLAVAPFDVLDPSLQIWHEGLADLLSRSLDGAGPLRTVSQTVALRGWPGRADPASAEALGHRTGAGLVVFGMVVPRGRDSVSLRAGILDGSAPRGQTQLEISGQAARMGDLADSLGFKILQVLGQSRPIGAVRQVSIGSKSLPALKAFLQGEQFYRRGAWDSALASYDRAIAADSDFGLAHHRMAVVLGWNPPSAGAYKPMEVYARRAMLFNQGLSPRDSLLIAAGYLNLPSNDTTNLGFSFRSMAALEEAVRRYPMDPEAWYELGEARFHSPFPGTTPARALEAFNHAIALDSGFAPAYEHMMGLTIRVGRPDLAAWYAARYVGLDPTGQNAASIRLAAAMLDPVQAKGPAAGRMIDSASVHTIFSAAMEHLGSLPDSEETAIRLLRALGKTGRPAGGDAPWVLDTLMWHQYLAKALALRGHLHDAYETDRQLVLQPEASPFSAFQDPFLDLSLLGIVPDSIATATFAHALDAGAPWSNSFGLTPRYLRGLPWWLDHGDTVSLARFAKRTDQAARRSHPSVEALRIRLLGTMASGYLALLRGDSAAALRRLEAMPDTLCLASDYDANCFHAKLTLAQLLAARGEDRRAADLLDTWRWTGGGPSFVLATLELGRLYERSGERRRAIECYRFVTAVWHRPDEALQPYVTEGREALQSLGGT
jgi:eukaryotic-like serine/threonine-protein kinase